MYGLENKEIEQINKVFAKYDCVEEVMLFGSRAKGTQEPFSDIDLTLIGKDITQKDLISIMEDLDNLLLPYEIDLSIFYNMENESLKEHIKRMNIVFYKKK